MLPALREMPVKNRSRLSSRSNIVSMLTESGDAVTVSSCMEGEAGHPADGRDILVLLAYRLAKAVNFNVAGKFGQLLLGQVAATMRVERLEQRRREAARTSEPCSRRDVGERGDFDLRGLEAQQAQAFPDDRMLNLRNLFDVLQLRVFQINSSVNGRVTVT